MSKNTAPTLLSRNPVYFMPDNAAVTVERSALYNDLKVSMHQQQGYTSHAVGWSEEVVAERWCLPPTDWPEHTMSRHRIGVVFSSVPISVSWSEGSGRKRHGVYTQGSINVMPQGLTTQAVWDRQLEIGTFEFSPEMIDRLLDGNGPAPSEQLVENRCVHDPIVYDLAHRIVAELTKPTERLYGEMLCLTLAVHLLSRYGRKGPNPVRRRLSPVQTRRVLDYMHSNFDGQLSIGAIARESGLSDACFARAFRATFNESPHQIILRWRLERAARLIARRGFGLAAAATAAGFYDQAHLTRSMRRHFGKTPGSLLNK